MHTSFDQWSNSSISRLDTINNVTKTIFQKFLTIYETLRYWPTRGVSFSHIPQLQVKFHNHRLKIERRLNFNQFTVRPKQRRTSSIIENPRIGDNLSKEELPEDHHYYAENPIVYQLQQTQNGGKRKGSAYYTEVHEGFFYFREEKAGFGNSTKWIWWFPENPFCSVSNGANIFQI